MPHLHTVVLSRFGGNKGGKARAPKLPPRRGHALAPVLARWRQKSIPKILVGSKIMKFQDFRYQKSGKTPIFISEKQVQ
jgi:hypothetical protein